MLDLDAYFVRIRYAGSRAPTLETLNGIVHAHIQAIPFEIVTPLSMTSAFCASSKR